MGHAPLHRRGHRDLYIGLLHDTGAYENNEVSGAATGSHRDGFGEVLDGQLKGDVADGLPGVQLAGVKHALDELTGVEDEPGGSAVGDEHEVETPAGGGVGVGAEDGDLEAFGGFIVCPHGGGSEDEECNKTDEEGEGGG